MIESTERTGLPAGLLVAAWMTLFLPVAAQADPSGLDRLGRLLGESPVERMVRAAGPEAAAWAVPAGEDADEAPAARAQEEEEAEPENVEPPVEEVVEPTGTGLFDRLQIHGFLTQAYAEADFADGGFDSPLPDERIVGITESGTTDYRNLALQVRYEISPRDNAVIQLSHRALGNSPITTIEDDVEFDWAFYERRLGESSYLKVGRIQIPLGIFNEIRDVGTLLPFFRPTFTFYREGSFSSETVDGVMVGRSFRTGQAWSFDVDLFYGGWDLVEVNQATGEAAIARAEDAFGFHVWVDTPHPAIRVGGGGQVYHVSGGFLRRPGTQTTWNDWHVSLDANFERWVARAEFRDNEFRATSELVPLTTVPLQAYYTQVGYRFTPRWQLWAQYEKAEAERESERFVETVNLNFRTDYALAINYRLRPNVVFKIEHHLYDIDSFRVAQVLPSPTGPLLRWEVQPAEDGRQTILSASVSF